MAASKLCMGGLGLVDEWCTGLGGCVLGVAGHVRSAGAGQGGASGQPDVDDVVLTSGQANVGHMHSTCNSMLLI